MREIVMRDGVRGVFGQAGWDISNPVWTRNDLVDIRYFNRRLVDSYLEQTGGVPKQRLSKKALGIIDGGMNFGWSSQDAENSVDDHDKLVTLIARLRKNDLITGERPRRAPSFPSGPTPLVLERITARQFVFPQSLFETLNGLRNLKVWVSEPERGHFSDTPFAWTGSYLFLTELEFDNGAFQSTFSGCSALRFIFNQLENRDTLDRSGTEILGRFDERTIDEKLQDLGAAELCEREITTLYKIRYMTDEQYHPEAPDGRVHDILGYPIFIAE